MVGAPWPHPRARRGRADRPMECLDASTVPAHTNPSTASLTHKQGCVLPSFREVSVRPATCAHHIDITQNSLRPSRTGTRDVVNTRSRQTEGPDTTGRALCATQCALVTHSTRCSGSGRNSNAQRPPLRPRKTAPQPPMYAARAGHAHNTYTRPPRPGMYHHVHAHYTYALCVSQHSAVSQHVDRTSVL